MKFIKLFEPFLRATCLLLTWSGPLSGGCSVIVRNPKQLPFGIRRCPRKSCWPHARMLNEDSVSALLCGSAQGLPVGFACPAVPLLLFDEVPDYLVLDLLRWGLLIDQDWSVKRWPTVTVRYPIMSRSETASGAHGKTNASHQHQGRILQKRILRPAVIATAPMNYVLPRTASRKLELPIRSLTASIIDSEKVSL